MFKRITLKNFKAWRDSGDITLAPVTLLLGANSTGKSSLLQSLLLLKQTVNSPDRTVQLNLGGDEANDYFNFGLFENVLTQGASPRQIEIGFDFTRPLPREITHEIKSHFISEGSFQASYAMTSSGPAIQELCLVAGDFSCRAIRRDKGAYSLFISEESQPRGKSRSFAPERSIALPAEAIARLSLEGSKVEDISLAIRRELESIAYLGPLRRRPERDYVWNKSKPGELGDDGGGAINALFASELLHRNDENNEDLLTGVSKWLHSMGMAERLEVRQLGRSTRYEIVVHRDGVEANLRDVGIGVSQVLPVLILAFFAPPGSTILLEEPEIHLHPLAQSKLADLFVEVSKKRKVQFIVETHSEHLFRRMQTLIAQQVVTTEGCQMYFVERKKAAAKLRMLDVDEFGVVSNWPDKFFGDAVGEAREQAKARAARMAKGLKQDG